MCRSMVTRVKCQDACHRTKPFDQSQLLDDDASLFLCSLYQFLLLDVVLSTKGLYFNQGQLLCRVPCPLCPLCCAKAFMCYFQKCIVTWSAVTHALGDSDLTAHTLTASVSSSFIACSYSFNVQFSILITVYSSPFIQFLGQHYCPGCSLLKNGANFLQLAYMHPLLLNPHTLYTISAHAGHAQASTLPMPRLPCSQDPLTHTQVCSASLSLSQARNIYVLTCYKIVTLDLCLWLRPLGLSSEARPYSD